MSTPFHLMVIDDQVSDLFLFQEVLELDFPEVRCTTTFHVEVALACCHEASSCPHLILLDLHLGPTSGLTVLRTLKAHPATRGIPVVIYSAIAHPDDVHAAYNAQASGYLVKPLGLDELRTTLTHLLNHWNDVRSARPI